MSGNNCRMKIALPFIRIFFSDKRTKRVDYLKLRFIFVQILKNAIFFLALSIFSYIAYTKISERSEPEMFQSYANSSKKSNRTVIFDNKGIIIENKKHYKSYHMKTGLNRYAYIAYGVVAVVALIVGPFPALL